jgi:hypothetical protein
MCKSIVGLCLAGLVMQVHHPQFPTFRRRGRERKLPTFTPIPTHPASPTFNLFDQAMTPSPANDQALKRQRTSSVTTVALQCQVCHRSYERADHLDRHLDSRETTQRMLSSTSS